MITHNGECSNDPAHWGHVANQSSELHPHASIFPFSFALFPLLTFFLLIHPPLLFPQILFLCSPSFLSSFLTPLSFAFRVSITIHHLLFLFFSHVFFSAYFSVCLQEVPRQWGLLSVPGSGPDGPLWPFNSCLGEGQQPPELAVLPLCFFDPARPIAAGLPAPSPNKSVQSQRWRMRVCVYERECVWAGWFAGRAHCHSAAIPQLEWPVQRKQ